MHFDEMDAGDFKIYTGALEVPPRGYRAALIIKRIRGVAASREVHRDESMAGGHVWDTPTEALRHAMQVGRRLVTDELMASRR